MFLWGSRSIMGSHAIDYIFRAASNVSKIEAEDSLKVYSTVTIVMRLTISAIVQLLSII
jgi:hypothetical protein